jgi:hypothetical protein
MTHSLVFTLLVLVSSAPLLLMPALLAMQARQEGRGLIVVGNLVLWGCVCLSLSSVFGTVSAGPAMEFPLRPSILLSLIGWLVLLRFAIQPVKPKESEGAAQSSQSMSPRSKREGSG